HRQQGQLGQAGLVAHRPAPALRQHAHRDQADLDDDGGRGQPAADHAGEDGRVGARVGAAAGAQPERAGGVALSTAARRRAAVFASATALSPCRSPTPSRDSKRTTRPVAISTARKRTKSALLALPSTISPISSTSSWYCARWPGVLGVQTGPKAPEASSSSRS